MDFCFSALYAYNLTSSFFSCSSLPKLAQSSYQQANIIQSQLKTQTKAHSSVLVWAGLAEFALLTLCSSCASSCACLIGRITVAITKKMALSVKPSKFSHDWRKLRGPDAEIASELETGFSYKHESMKPRFRPDSLVHFLSVQREAEWERRLAALSQAAGWMWGRRWGKGGVELQKVKWG